MSPYGHVLPQSSLIQGEMLVHLSDFLKLVKRCIFTHIPAQLASIALSCGGTLFETSFSQKYQCAIFFQRDLIFIPPNNLTLTVW